MCVCVWVRGGPRGRNQRSSLSSSASLSRAQAGGRAVGRARQGKAGQGNQPPPKSMQQILSSAQVKSIAEIFTNYTKNKQQQQQNKKEFHKFLLLRFGPRIHTGDTYTHTQAARGSLQFYHKRTHTRTHTYTYAPPPPAAGMQRLYETIKLFSFPFLTLKRNPKKAAAAEEGEQKGNYMLRHKSSWERGKRKKKKQKILFSSYTRLRPPVTHGTSFTFIFLAMLLPQSFATVFASPSPTRAR